MKKRRLTPVFVVASVFALVLGTSALAGCVAPQTSNDEEVLAQLEEMQAQIDELEATLDTETNDASSTEDASTNESDTQTDAANTSETTDVADASSAEEFAALLDDLSSRVDDAVATAAAVEVPSNVSDRPAAYFDAKAPLEELENELDRIDDAIEAAARQGTLAQDEVWTLEQQEDAIDNKLDQAEDELELRMGVDD